MLQPADDTAGSAPWCCVRRRHGFHARCWLLCGKSDYGRLVIATLMVTDVSFISVYALTSVVVVVAVLCGLTISVRHMSS